MKKIIHKNKNSKYTIIIATLILASIFATGLVSAEGICSYIQDDLQATVGKEIPSYIPYGNEVFNVKSSETEKVGYIAIEDSVITDIGCNDSLENATYVLYVKNLDTVKTIATSESPADALDQAMSDGDLTLEGQSFGKKLKASIMRFGIKIASWFS